MPKVIYISDAGQRTVVDAVAGESVMTTAVKNGVPGIIGECGGEMACSTCHVYVAPEWRTDLPEISEMEDELLDGTASDRTDDSRLACQIPVTEGLDGIVVTTPETQVF